MAIPWTNQNPWSKGDMLSGNYRGSGSGTLPAPTKQNAKGLGLDGLLEGGLQTLLSGGLGAISPMIGEGIKSLFGFDDIGDTIGGIFGSGGSAQQAADLASKTALQYTKDSMYNKTGTMGQEAVKRETGMRMHPAAPAYAQYGKSMAYGSAAGQENLAKGAMQQGLNLASRAAGANAKSIRDAAGYVSPSMLARLAEGGTKAAVDATGNTMQGMYASMGDALRGAAGTRAQGEQNFMGAKQLQFNTEVEPYFGIADPSAGVGLAGSALAAGNAAMTTAGQNRLLLDPLGDTSGMLANLATQKASFKQGVGMLDWLFGDRQEEQTA